MSPGVLNDPPPPAPGAWGDPWRCAPRPPGEGPRWRRWVRGGVPAAALAPAPAAVTHSAAHAVAFICLGPGPRQPIALLPLHRQRGGCCRSLQVSSCSPYLQKAEREMSGGSFSLPAKYAQARSAAAGLKDAPRAGAGWRGGG